MGKIENAIDLSFRNVHLKEMACYTCDAFDKSAQENIYNLSCVGVHNVDIGNNHSNTITTTYFLVYIHSLVVTSTSQMAVSCAVSGDIAIKEPHYIYFTTGAEMTENRK